METLSTQQPSLIKRAGLAGLCLFAACLLYGGIAGATATPAEATNFCANVTLAPYGAYGDRCYAWPWESGKLIEVGILTSERSGCVTFSAQNSGDLLDSWSCAAKASGIYKYASNDGTIRRGVIRNNNLSYSGHFDGFYGCCYP